MVRDNFGLNANQTVIPEIQVIETRANRINFYQRSKNQLLGPKNIVAEKR